MQATVADHKERALLADSLKEALEVQRVAAEQLQAALREQQRSVSEDLQRVGVQFGQAMQWLEFGLVHACRWTFGTMRGASKYILFVNFTSEQGMGL